MIPVVSPSYESANFYRSESVCQKLQEIAQKVVDIALAVLFVVANVLVVSAITPTFLYPYVLPVVTLSSTLLASFFYVVDFLEPSKLSADNEVPLAQNQKILLAQEVTKTLKKEGYPVGLRNRHNNCFLNALVQNWQIDDEIKKRLVQLLPQGNEFASYLAFLNEYKLPQTVIDELQQTYSVNIHPRKFLKNFFESFDPSILSETDRRTYSQFKETYRKLSILDQPFRKFFEKLDKSPFSISDADTQDLRSALIKLNCQEIQDIFGKGYQAFHIQADSVEIYRIILDILPPSFKFHFQQRLVLNQGENPPLQNPEMFVDKVDDILGLSWNDKNPNLQTLIDEFFNEICHEGNHVTRFGLDGISYSYSISSYERKFQDMPNHLKIQLRRDRNRLNEKVDVPLVLKIATDDENYVEYELKSTIIHRGVERAGHYVSTVRNNEGNFYLDDSRVESISEEDFLKYTQSAYFLSYQKKI